MMLQTSNSSIILRVTLQLIKNLQESVAQGGGEGGVSLHLDSLWASWDQPLGCFLCFGFDPRLKMGEW